MSSSAEKKVKTETKSIKVIIPKVDIGTYDWRAYAGDYSGHGKIIRLLFIADKAKGKEIEALKFAIDEIKKTSSTKYYLQVLEKLEDRGGPEYKKDQSWIDSTDRQSTELLSRYEGDLNLARTQLNRENIRRGHAKLGDVYYERADLHAALRCYVRTRDYCNDQTHVLDMCLSVIKVSIEMQNFAHVINYVTKARQTDKRRDPLISSKLSVSAALAHLDGKKYRQAARKFLEAKSVLIGQYKDIISGKDIAIYGGLCALASFTRGELRAQVLENVDFNRYLDLVPDMKEIINSFYESKYATCLESLGKLEDRLKIDLHLHDHFHLLFKKIRDKAIKQYFAPFVSVDMKKMATAFNTTADRLEAELTQLILSGELQARIDSFNKVLYARTINQRSVSFEKSLAVGAKVERETKDMILRMNILKANFAIQEKRRKDDKSD